MAIDAPRAQLIHIETDRRLGHEWDEWDGGPLPNRGDFSAPPGLFFRFAALTLVVLCGAAAGVLFLLSPRLAALAPALPRAAGWALAGAFGLPAPWLPPAPAPVLSRRGPPPPPPAVAAPGCGEELTRGLRDVAGQLPVLGLTMRLANGPCRDAMIDLDVMETWVRGLVGA